MKRYGEVLPIDTVMEFQKGKRYEGMYETPFGAFQMEILTNHVENRLHEGVLDIDYAISLKGLVETHSQLNITILEQ